MFTQFVGYLDKGEIKLLKMVIEWTEWKANIVNTFFELWFSIKFCIQKLSNHNFLAGQDLLIKWKQTLSRFFVSVCSEA